MADIYTTHATAENERAYKRNANPSYRALQAPLMFARFTHTFAADPSNDDNLILGHLGVPNARVIPELSRVTSVTGAVNADFTLEKISVDGGTPTAVSGAASVDDSSVAFARVAGGALVEVEQSEKLQATLSAATALVATDVVEILVAFISDERQ